MARPCVFNWTAANTSNICEVQTLGAAGNLVINGELVTTSYGAGISASVSSPLQAIPTFVGCSRTVSITSSSNNSTIMVTVTGTYQGAAQTETLAGPNATTIYTTKLFETVKSVSTNAATVGAGLSVGAGTTGNTNWYLYDYHTPYSAMSIQVVVTGTINYTFQSTLDDVNTVVTPTVNAGVVIPKPGDPNAYQTVLSGATATAFGYLNYPIRYANVKVNSATDGTLAVTFIQQGIR